MKSFTEKLQNAIERNNSLLCLGLDPDPAQYPAHFAGLEQDITGGLAAWGRRLIEQTADLVCCYKPNFAFYEQHGPPGLAALRQTIAAVPDDIPVLLDAKRGDIGHTALAYARAAFEVWGADAITLSPYLGRDTVAPFLRFPGKAVFVLCYTSNPAAEEIQEFNAGEERLFEYVARRGQSWGGPDQVGFVSGATRPETLARVRALAPDRWLLAPGVGAQGGDLDQAVAAGLERLIVPVSRAILYAEEPRAAAHSLRQRINRARERHQKPSDPPFSDLAVALYEAGCVQFGDFTLASGRQSPIYIDLRRLMARPALLRRTARLYAGLVRPLSFDHLAAVPYAALTIGTAVSLAVDKPLIYPRKEAKTYGTGRAIEGVFSAGDKVVVIEDLVTSGGSVLKAIEVLEANGLVVEDALVLIDRQQGGREALAAAGYRLQAILKLTDLLESLRRSGHIPTDKFNEVMHYIQGET